MRLLTLPRCLGAHAAAASRQVVAASAVLNGRVAGCSGTAPAHARAQHDDPAAAAAVALVCFVAAALSAGEHVRIDAGWQHRRCC